MVQSIEFYLELNEVGNAHCTSLCHQLHQASVARGFILKTSLTSVNLISHLQLPGIQSLTRPPMLLTIE